MLETSIHLFIQAPEGPCTDEISTEVKADTIGTQTCGSQLSQQPLRFKSRFVQLPLAQIRVCDRCTHKHQPIWHSPIPSMQPLRKQSQIALLFYGLNRKLWFYCIRGFLYSFEL